MNGGPPGSPKLYAMVTRSAVSAGKTAPPAHEVFVFALGNVAENETQQRHDYYHAYRWDLITTVGWLKPDNESICWAHKHGAREFKIELEEAASARV